MSLNLVVLGHKCERTIYHTIFLILGVGIQYRQRCISIYFESSIRTARRLSSHTNDLTLEPEVVVERCSLKPGLYLDSVALSETTRGMGGGFTVDVCEWC
jgi:hypothetical protein